MSQTIVVQASAVLIQESRVGISACIMKKLQLIIKGHKHYSCERMIERS